MDLVPSCDFETLLDFIGSDGTVVSKINNLLPMESLSDLNSRLVHMSWAGGRMDTCVGFTMTGPEFRDLIQPESWVNLEFDEPRPTVGSNNRCM